MRVVRTKLCFCLCVVDSEVSLCDGHICDGIVFDILHVVTTLSMFLCVFLGLVTTLWVKIGLFLGLSDTFEILECIRWTDIVEPFFVFGIKTIVCATKTNITVWIRCNGSVAAAQTTDQTKTYNNTVLLWYILTPGKGAWFTF